MRLVRLPWINCIVRDIAIDGHEAWYPRESVIANAEQSELVVADRELAHRVDFSLAPVLCEAQIAVAECRLSGNPSADLRVLRAPNGNEIRVAGVEDRFERGCDLRTQPVSRGKIHRVVSVAHVERGPVGFHISNSMSD